MLVKDRMTANPITIHENATFDEGLRLIREKKVRRLPVLDDHGRLVGIIAEKDLLYASPSPATSLSIYEINYLLAKLQVREIMKRKVITTTEDTPLEDAAQVMTDNKIGCLPVMRDGRLIGIITETDIFKSLLELLGSRRSGVRMTMRVPDAKGVLAKMTGEIARLGGNIVNLGVFHGKERGEAYVVVKVQDVPRKDLVAAMETIDGVVVDAREG